MKRHEATGLKCMSESGRHLPISGRTVKTSEVEHTATNDAVTLHVSRFKQNRVVSDRVEHGRERVYKAAHPRSLSPALPLLCAFVLLPLRL